MANNNKDANPSVDSGTAVDGSCVDNDDEACNMWLNVNQENISSPESAPKKASSFVTTFGFLSGASDQSQSSSDTVVMSSATASALGSGNAIIVNTCQRGNPMLEQICNVPWKYADTGAILVADYILGPSTCCLFLSLRYHALKPDYIYDRLKRLKIGGSFSLKLMLCLADVKDPTHAVRELAKACLIADVTLVLAFSNAEAATYLETFKAYQNKPADIIKSRPSVSYSARAVEVLSSVRTVNSTDAHTLLTTFESLSNIANTTEEQLGLCPGIGGVKARTLHKLFDMPFLKVLDENEHAESK